MKNICSLIVHRLMLDPDRVVVVSEQGEASAGLLLDLLLRWFETFEREGVVPGDYIVVSEPRDVELVSGLLAAAMSGAVFVPIGNDSEGVLQRRASAVNAAFTLGSQRIDGLRHLDLKKASRSGRSIESFLYSGAGPAYVYFTSGSTGEPKGVVLGRRNAERRIVNAIRELELGVLDNVIFKTPLVFDVAIVEVFATLAAGSTLHILQSGRELDARSICALLSGLPSRSVVVHFVPTALELFCEVATDWQTDAVRLLHTSGESIRAAVARLALTRFTGACFANMYGQTETSEVCVWRGRLSDLESLSGQVPIGEAIRPYLVECVDLDGSVVGPGARGELIVGGPDALADSYVTSGTTSELADLSLTGSCRRGRWYRTGDVARSTPEGFVIEGRSVGFVKVNGTRVELSALVEVVERLPSVHAAVAWVESKGPLEHITLGIAGTVASQAIEEHIYDRLPAQYRPAKIVVVSAYRTLPSGKVDRAALASDCVQP